MSHTSHQIETDWPDDRPRLRPPLAPDPNPPLPPPRFGLKTAFVLMAAMATSLGLFRWLGSEGLSLLAVWLFTLPLVVAACLYRRHRVAASWAMALFGLFILVSALAPAVTYPRVAARRTVCINSLKQLNLALLNYATANGSFPPAYVLGPDGKPWHSWRVLILPYIEQQPLYDQYRFDEPWYSPHNSQVAAFMPQLFRCPSDDAQPATSNFTSYVAVVGPETAWPDARTTSPGSIPDGTSNTLLIVEVADSGIVWTQPADLKSAMMPLRVNSPQGIRSEHADGANVAVADGSVHTLPSSTTGQELRALLTAAGGESLKNFPGEE